MSKWTYDSGEPPTVGDTVVCVMPSVAPGSFDTPQVEVIVYGVDGDFVHVLSPLGRHRGNQCWRFKRVKPPTYETQQLAECASLLESCRAEIRCLYRQLTSKAPEEATGSVRSVLDRINQIIGSH
jgi:hypothetical protein